MKFKNISKIIFTMLAMALAAIAFACGNSANTNVAVQTNSIPANSNPNQPNTSTQPMPEQKPPTMTDVPVGNAKSPTEAYRMLFAAVKSQDSSKIKSMMSKGSIGFAEMAAAQRKISVEEMLKNGFTETTFADDYPQMRDERIKGNFGAVEVWNKDRKSWEDLPFVLEDGSWKMAIGDAFANKWTSPGKGQAMIEQENANAQNPNSMIRINPAGNTNINANTPGGKFPGGGVIKKKKD
jgi:hypothetical protein